MIEWVEAHPAVIGYAVTILLAVATAQWRLIRYLTRIEAQLAPNGGSTPRKQGDGHLTVREEIDGIREVALLTQAATDMHWSLHEAQHEAAKRRFEQLLAIVERAHPDIKEWEKRELEGWR